ncbi:MAG: reverse transcriptase domain-containing protein [Flavobacteriaceae bacterium]
MKKKEHPWIKLKKYPHIGFPIEWCDVPKLETYITNNSKIAKHSFLPFIHRTIFQRKYRALNNGERNPSKKRKREKNKRTKAREIHFASHFDAQIYSYYSYLLSKKYNDLLKTKNFNKSVVAYRKIEIEGKKDKHKCNIDFALDTFQFIKNQKDKELTVIVADVTKFFDSLNHSILKKKWKEVLGEKVSLPADHYNVFKSLTKMRYVNEDLLFRNYKDKIWVSTREENNPKKKRLKQKSFKKKHFLKDNNAVSYCDRDTFFKNSLHLISKSTNSKGIPQGTALSATLANIYMLDFDQKVQDYINSVNGYYQRYSDDLIIVVPRKCEKEAINMIRSLVKEEAKLEIHPDKTTVYHFYNKNSQFVGYEIDEKTQEIKNKKLEYLGFEFDGERVLIKTAGYSKFYRSMKRSFKRATSLAVNAKSVDDEIHKGALYKRFTYKGAKRKRVYNKKTKTEKYDWGNYLSYVEKANASFRTFNGGNQIKRQSRKSWSSFHTLLNTSLKEIQKKQKSF